MHVLITGAAGMIGRKLTRSLIELGQIGGVPLERLSLVDVVAAGGPSNFGGQVDVRVEDLAVPSAATRLIASKPDLIFHLAGVVSGDAEVNLEKGYQVNFDGTRALLNAIRTTEGYRPKFVFTSSIAVYGAPFPAGSIADDFNLTPMTSYGAQKAMSELLLSDYHRRGFVDGVGIRLPTICVRPGKPNKAASGFFSGIIREPLSGKRAALPVPDTVRHIFASPRSGVGFLLHAATLDRSSLGNQINLAMPSVSCTVAEQIEALERVAGSKAVSLIFREPDDLVLKIVENWPQRISADRARALGFTAEARFEDIIRVYLEDDLEA